jgi:tetratricopeptide (TPR) repeat protein
LGDTPETTEGAMKAICRRWTDLGDREAVGEGISDEESRFRREHVAECEPCAREARLWGALAASFSEPHLGHSERNEVTAERILRALAAEEEALAKAVPRTKWGNAFTGPAPARAAFASRVIVPVAAALALAASVVLFLAGRGSRAPSASQTHAEVRSVSGDVTIDGRHVAVGAPIAVGATIRSEGSVCFHIEGDVDTCLREGTVARFADAAPAHRVVELRRGQLEASLKHQTPGTFFRVETSRGSVTAIGTAFSVAVASADGPVVVRVQEGVVAVLPRVGSERRVFAGQETVLTAEEAKAEDDAQGEAGTRSAIPAAPARGGNPESPSSAPPRPSEEDTRAGEPSAGELLREARALRAAGSFHEAADTYRRLRTAFPESAEAHVSLVSLGDLELSQLGDAEAALRTFDAYLVKGGDLSEEAEFGRILALRSLGRDATERESIAAFLLRYPSTLHKDVLHARLRVLGGGAGAR